METIDARKAYKAAWYLKNKERLAARMAARYQENRDAVLAKAKAEYAAERGIGGRS